MDVNDIILMDWDIQYPVRISSTQIQLQDTFHGCPASTTYVRYYFGGCSLSMWGTLFWRISMWDEAVLEKCYLRRIYYCGYSKGCSGTDGYDKLTQGHNTAVLIYLKSLSFWFNDKMIYCYGLHQLLIIRFYLSILEIFLGNSLKQNICPTPMKVWFTP